MSFTIDQLAALIDAQAQELGRVNARLAAAGIPDLVTTIDRLDVRLEAGKAYRLKPGSYATSTTFNVAGASVDATGSTITLTSSVKYASVVTLSGDKATFTGGTLTLANDMLLDPKKPEAGTYANTQRAIAIDGRATNALVDGVTLGGKNANFAIFTGSTNTTIRGCVADWLAGYFIYAESAVGLTIDGCRVTGGCTVETCLRFEGCDGLIVRNCAMVNAGFKTTVVKAHRGRNYLFDSNVFTGVVENGPMGDGGGGRELPVGPERVASLAARLDGVTWRNCKLTGIFAWEAGVLNGVVDGCSIAAFPANVGTANVLAQPFNRINADVYPQPAFQKHGDVVRPKTIFTFKNTAISGAADLAKFVPANAVFVGCSYNGAAFGR